MLAVVYWSGTGNTERMAEEIEKGAKEKGKEVKVFQVLEFPADQLAEFDAVAFGCPSMGAEQLEDGEFEPVFEALKPKLSGKRILLFGSYGWGDGEWMRIWEEDCRDCGAVLAEESIICCGEPDESVCEKLQAAGAALG